MGEQPAGRRRRTSEAPGRSGTVPVIRFSRTQAMAGEEGGAQTRRQPRPGLLRQVQHLEADEEGDQETGDETGLSAAKRILPIPTDWRIGTMDKRHAVALEPSFPLTLTLCLVCV